MNIRHWRNVCLLIALVMIANVSASEKNNAAPFKDDSMLLKSALEKAHPSYKRYASDAELAGIWASFESSTQNASLSPLKYYAAVSKLLAGLKCDHTKAELPASLADMKKKRMLPFTFRFFENRMFVDGSAQEELKRGYEITHINDIPVLQILSSLRPYVSVDGFTDHIVHTKIEHDSDLVGSALEEFFAPIVLGLDEYPSQYSITYKANEYNARKLDVDVIDFNSWRQLSFKPYRLDFKDAVALTYIEEGTALLTVNTFVNYRKPVDANALFSELFKELNTRGVNTLIVDLRLNGGGSHDAQIALMKHLHQSPFQLVSGGWLSPFSIDPIKDQLKSWDKTFIDIDKTKLTIEDKGARLDPDYLGPNAKSQTPAPDAFNGEIIMLSSQHNASASAALLSHASNQDNITIIGELTGGNQGGTSGTNIAFLPLPESGVTVRIPLVRNQYNINDASDGLGATPSIYVSQSLDDWLLGKDTILDFATSMTVSEPSR